MIIFLIYMGLFVAATYGSEEIRWCLINHAEKAKCDQMSTVIKTILEFARKFTLICVHGRDVFDCMERLQKRDVDLMGLDAGLGYYAAHYYGMRAMAFEVYDKEKVIMANAVVVKGSVTSPVELKGTSACHSGTGTVEGWIYPLSKMIKEHGLKVTQCASEVKILDAFFTEGSCAPGSQFSIFNTLGDNPLSSCSRCASSSDTRAFCSSTDPYAGSAGAMLCLDKARREGRVAVAFIRGDVVSRMADNRDINATHFELLCHQKQKDGTYVAPLEQGVRCSWGRLQSRMVMTQLTSDRLRLYEDFLTVSIAFFGSNGTMKDLFKLFESTGPYTLSQELQLILGQSGLLEPQQPHYDLIFSDSTRNIHFPPNEETVDYLSLMSQDLKDALETIHKCPFPAIKWCSIDEDDLEKCGKLKLALDSENLRPTLLCVLGGSVFKCIKLISDGFADTMTVDPAEMYIGGKYHGLVPLAVEYFGENSHYYAVAVAKKENKDILISNWRGKNLCHGAAGKAVGWVIPITVALMTGQFKVERRNIIDSYAQLVYRACVPGILDYEFTRKEGQGVKLCELCSGGGADYCKADTNEPFFTDIGAFCCLLEVGDLAFMKHFTVFDHTDGRNDVQWARNRHSDDYELLCLDGRRTDVHSWMDCNLGQVPGDFVVTAAFKSPKERDMIWRLLRVAQERFGSRSATRFNMFINVHNRYDQMFSDGATQLKHIPPINQSYDRVLDRAFVKMCENLENLSKPGYSGFYRP